MSASSGQTYQTIVAAPGFCLGVRCDDNEIFEIEFLETRPPQPATGALASETARQLNAYLQDPGFVFGLPLRPSGTRFQRRVWEQISAIPNRQTRTYGELARALHSAPRAVGQACGANPFPLVIPCHRIIATGGGLGGFARHGGGFLLEVKRWLLSHERP